ncbi:MAG: alpha-amylase family glycosyl hydrolase [Inhella sp.]
MRALFILLLSSLFGMNAHADCRPAPKPASELFLRGSMNNWAALEDYQFRWHCDAWVLNLQLNNRHEFKIADADWSPASIVAANAQGAPATVAQGGHANLVRQFEGEHTLSLRFDAEGRPQLQLGPKTAPDVVQAPITDPVALSLRFDSRQLAHKSPFGAQPLGSTLRFAVTAEVPGLRAVHLVVERRQLEGNQERLHYEPLARVALLPKPHGLGSRFEGEYRFADIGIYGYWFEVETEQGRYALQNNKDSVYWTRERGSMGPGVVERLPENLAKVRRYRQTIHLKDLRVPEWAADVIYYYVFPERFRNGNKANDPQPGRQRYQTHDIERHARWLEKPHRPGEAGDAVHNNDFFGGDLAGIIEKLDDIRALGANTLYMTPVFQAASNHKYDTGDYHRIDPGFGTNADFERLAREAKKRGLRVILDTSLNHVGSDSPYFDRFGNFGGKDGASAGAFAGGKPNPKSPYYDWFLFDTTKSDPNEQYQGWVGVKDLPELNKASEAWRRFAYRDADSVTRRWLRAGSSGWRMDVAPWVPDDFWREWSATVKQTKPDALTVAETWFDASKYFLGDQFDSTMNYIFRNAVLDYAAGGKARQIIPSLELTREAYPAPMLHANMNLLSTHDQARALHHFGIQGNPHTDAAEDPAKLTEAKQRLKLALLFQIGFPGAPTVYYGDEVGVGGGDDPYNRAPYPWADEGGQPDLTLRAEFQRLLALRHQHAVLRRGTLEAPLLLTDEVVVLRRTLGNTQALVAMNNAREPREITLQLPAGSGWQDLLDASLKPRSAPDGTLTLTLPPLFGRLLLSIP